MAFAGAADFIAAMAQNKFDSVIGQAETVWLEFKSQPYLPWNDEAKRLEFAKDASAMANGGGGLIVFGYQTEADDLTARDIVKARTPVSIGHVDIDGYKKSLEQWTYPPMRSIVLKWWGLEEGKGVLSIEVPAATESQQPVLVIKASIEGMKRSILVGHFVRTEDRVSESMAAELHADIRLGRMLNQAGMGGPRFTPSAPSGPTDEQRRQRLEADTNDGQFRA